MNEFDNVNKPKHYNSHPSRIQCIAVTRALNFNLGNAYKYLFRRDHKNNLLENLEKALWYMKDEIDNWSFTGVSNIEQVKKVAGFISEHEPFPFAEIMHMIVSDDLDDVAQAHDLLEAEIKRIKQEGCKEVCGETDSFGAPLCCKQ